MGNKMADWKIGDPMINENDYWPDENYVAEDKEKEKLILKLATLITERLTVPTIGIGAGAGCDGQVLVYQDMLGMYADFTPKFVKKFSNVGEVMQAAFAQYVAEVQNGSFPSEEHCYAIDDAIIRRLEEEQA